MQSSKKLLIISLLCLAISACNTKKVDMQKARPIAQEEVQEMAREEDVYYVENPSNSANLYVKIIHPSDWEGGELPTIFLVPGSSGDSSEFMSKKKSAQDLADEGFTVVIFDSDGRGKSTGEEDYGGFIQQDGLKAIIEYVSKLEEVDADKMGIASFSFGVTMASGLLSRYPDLPIKFLSDYEGPANRDDTAGCDGSGLGHLGKQAECDEESFWKEREASTFIAKIKVPYWRIQTEKDHAQPDYQHTVVMINAALDGGGQKVYLNEDQIISQLDENNLPKMASDSVDIHLMSTIAEHVKKLL